MGEPFTSGSQPEELDPDHLRSFPFFPNQFYSELPLPRAMEAASRLICVVLIRDGRLSRGQKEMLLRGVGTVLRNSPCALCFKQAPPAQSPQDRQLLKFTMKLAQLASQISEKDVESLRQIGCDDAAILEAIVTTATGRMFCTLADGLVPPPVQPAAQLEALPDLHSAESTGPYLALSPILPDDFAPYRFLREQFGRVPNIFSAQALRPDILEAEVNVLSAILFPADLLSRVQKENILLLISARNLNSYFVAVHTEILTTLGVSREESKQMIANLKNSALSQADKSLLDFACRLANPQKEKMPAQELSEHGFTNHQIVEAIAMTALTNFLNTVQFGLGTVV